MTNPKLLYNKISWLTYYCSRGKLASTFELLQEPMRFVLAQVGLVELLFMFADQCLYVTKNLNSIC